MNWLSVQRGLIAEFAVVFAIFALSVVLAYFSEDERIRDESWVRHTVQVREGLAGIVSKAVDLETGERGFVITGQEEFLQPYFDARERIPSELKRIGELTVDNPLERKKIAVLERLIADLLEQHARVIRATNERGLEFGRKLVLTGQGKKTMDAIREVVEVMTTEETRLLRSRQNKTISDGRRQVWFLLALAILTGTILSGAYALIRRHIAARLQAERVLEESEENLQVTLRSIGDGVLTTDAEGRITRLNPLAERLTGWNLDEAKGRPVGEVFRIINEETRQPAVIPVDDVLASGVIHGLANHTALIARDGSEYPIADSAAPMRDIKGRIVGVVLVFRDVTESRAREVELARFKSTLDQTLDSIFMFRPDDFRFIYVNEGGKRQIGYTEAEILRMTVLDIKPEFTLERFRQVVRPLLEGTQPSLTFQTLHRHKDGHGIPVEVYLQLVREAGREPRFVNIVRDITERKRVETERDRFFTLSLDMLCIAGMDGYFQRLNPAFTQTLGYATDELLARPFLDFVHPDDRAATSAEVEKLSRGEPTTHFENRYECKGGSWRWLAWKAQPVVEEGIIYATGRDITEQKTADAELRRSRAVFENLFKSLPGLFLVLTPDLEIVAASNAYLEATMTDRADLLGRDLFEAFPDNPEDPAATGTSNLRASLDRVRQTGAADTMAIQKYDVRRPDGVFEERYWSPINSPVLGMDGRIEYLIHRVEDVTEFVRQRSQPADNTIELRARMEQMQAEIFHNSRQLQAANHQLHQVNTQLSQAKTEADAANRAKSAFLSTMSHEIRTPMNAILGYAQLMLRDPGLGTDAKANLQIINRSGDHLLTLINNVLDMSKIEAGHTELKPTTFSLCGLLDSLAKMFRLRAEAKALRFEMFVDGESVPYVVADEGKIRQALINLLGNAIKFTESGQIKLHITLDQRNVNRLWLSARVEDTGLGMTNEEQEKLFQPFSQAKGGLNTKEGTGLGLAISREYARLMGGDLTVTSSPGVGSTFRFEVPIERGDAGVVTRRIAPRRVIGIRTEQEVPRILVVDDQAENRDWLVKFLEIIGFSVRGVDNGEAAIQSWDEWNPRLVLMDVHMPIMDGLEATRRIKTDPRGKDTVIIALTASAMEDQRRTAIQIGADDFVAKPCHEDELLEKMRAHLNIAYDYEEMSGNGNEAVARGAALSAEKLGRGQLPLELIEELRNATLSGNKSLMDKLILKVRGTGDTGSAHALQELADNYEYDSLTKLLEEACRR